MWVRLRGEGRIAVLDDGRALRPLPGAKASAIRPFLPTITGPAQVWFDPEGSLAFVASQQVAKVGVFRVNTGPDGLSRPAHL